jgi:PDZ domain
MMRRLVITALCLATAAPLGAQGAEIIIRRPGQRDMVIQLDSMQSRLKLDAVQRELGGIDSLVQHQFDKSWRGAMALRLDTMIASRKLGALRDRDSVFVKEFKLDSAMKTLNLALHDSMFARQSKILSHVRELLPSFAARPIIGVSVALDPRPTDKYGAYVEDVSPGGPADKAGIRSGDIITSLADKSLTTPDKGSMYGNDQSIPATRLIEIASQLEVGKPVNLQYRRGDTTRTVKVTPVEENTFMAFTAPTPAIAGRVFAVPSAPEVARAPIAPLVRLPEPDANGYSFSYFFNTGILSNVEMAPMNDKLGAYFGTSEGVLILNTGINESAHRDTAGTLANTANTTFGLQAGDVVVSIDGRSVASPSQLVRILSSYDRGDTFKMQIMREKKAQTLTAKMP